MSVESLQERKIILRGIDPLGFFGTQDKNLKVLESVLDTKIIARGNEIILRGQSSETENAERIITELVHMANRNGMITPDDIETVVRLSDGHVSIQKETDTLNSIILYTKHDYIKPKTEGQKKYYEATKKNDIVCSIGPAGTGKTYLSVAIALSYLRDKIVDRIVLCRPAVEAGENLGFLPGDYREKVDPYLRPLYDALYDMVPLEKLKKHLDANIIEIAPLAFMRGRTLNNSFVILDEAQNSTAAQMKMFLTRLGANSRAIITGDITQIDLPVKADSGLVQIQEVLKNIDGIDFVYLTEKDVVRHHLIKKIIKAYESYQVNHNKKSK
ncbi:PhoH family protein [candidate division KSB1 bacterium]|nr:PhoH family protein [candidate division KSB1 bacterium]